MTTNIFGKSDTPASSNAGFTAGKKWRVGSIFLNDYLIEKELGQGGMGRVYLVTSQSTGRQFAVKQALIKNDKHRKAFLTELQTWIDLPEHPNIVPCRFFRTVGNEIVIFADFIEGGSLSDWIAKRKLTSLEQILDVAIQFAWGLHAIHERGLIHQDVKPGNVLMTPEGVPMVTDFGLARTRLRATDGSFVLPELPPGQQSVLVSSGGMTPAYASPEQRAGKPLSRKTDIWSWGVSVLDMFMGDVSCPHGGQIAAEVLENFIENWHADEGLPKMPEEVAEALKKCFVRDSVERWVNIEQAAQKFIQTIQSVSGTIYGRINLPTPHFVAWDARYHRSIGNAGWRDPREWLREAYCLAGRDIRDFGHLQDRVSEGRKAKVIEDLVVLSEAEQVLGDLVRQGRSDVEPVLAFLYRDVGLLHASLDDYPGAEHACIRAIEIWEERIRSNPSSPSRNCLAGSCLTLGFIEKRQGNLQAADALYEKAISIWESVLQTVSSLEMLVDLATAYTNRAILAEEMGNFRLAEDLVNKSITIREKAAERYGANVPPRDIAAGYVAMASLSLRCKDHGAAIEAYDRALSLLPDPSDRSQSAETRDETAMILNNKAIAAESLGHLQEAVALYDQAISIRERLVRDEHCEEYLPELAGTYLNAAIAMQALGYWRGADDMLGQAVEAYEALVIHSGRRDLANDLARSHMHRAMVLEFLGEMPQAIAQYDKALVIRERLVNVDHRHDIADQLAGTYLNKAVAIQSTGAVEAAIALCDKAIDIRESLVATQASGVLLNHLAHTYMAKALALQQAGSQREAVALLEKAIRMWKESGTVGNDPATAKRQAFASQMLRDLTA